MPRRGRPAYVDKPVEFKVYLPSSIAARVKLECYNSLRQNITYGAQSAIIVQALQEFFNRKDNKNYDPSRTVDGPCVDTSSPETNQAGSTPMLQETTSPVESTSGDKGGA